MKTVKSLIFRADGMKLGCLDSSWYGKSSRVNENVQRAVNLSMPNVGLPFRWSHQSKRAGLVAAESIEVNQRYWVENVSGSSDFSGPPSEFGIIIISRPCKELDDSMK